MLKTLIIVMLLGFAMVIGVVYFILWPLAVEYLSDIIAAITPALQPIVETAQEVVPVLPQSMEINNLIAIFPLLEQIGVERIGQLKALAEGGITKEEAQQALEILSQQLSPEELQQLKTLLNIKQ
jgi:hypothetical protein